VGTSNSAERRARLAARIKGRLRQAKAPAKSAMRPEKAPGRIGKGWGRQRSGAARRTKTQRRPRLRRPARTGTAPRQPLPTARKQPPAIPTNRTSIPPPVRIRATRARRNRRRERRRREAAHPTAGVHRTRPTPINRIILRAPTPPPTPPRMRAPRLRCRPRRKGARRTRAPAPRNNRPNRESTGLRVLT
jgi:hypothetical protein